MKKLNLTPEKLLNKKFPTEISGYNATEVDQVLDYIIEDYKNYNQELIKMQSLINEKNALVDDREQEAGNLKIQIQNLKDQITEINKSSNYELAQKIDELTKLTREKQK